MPAIPLRWSECRQAPLFLMVVVLLAPVLALPDTDNWRGVKPLMIQAIAFCSVALLLSRARWSVEGLRRFLNTGPNLALMLLVAWAALSFALTAPTGGRGRGIALVEMLRLASGAAIYFAVAYRCNSRDSLKLAVILLLVGGWLASVAGMVSADVQEFHFETAAFGNSQLLAAFLVLLLPAPLIFAQRGKLTGARRLFAMGVTVMVVAALFLTHNRSSWVGSVVGLLVMAVLMFKSRARGEERMPQRRWIALAIIALASVAFFFTLLGKDSMVINRVSTFAFASRDKSFQWRQGMWSISEQIIRDHPIKGTGIGSFAMVANDYATRASSSALIVPSEPRNVVTVDGKSYSADVPSAEQVEKEGASMSSLPHNEYLQLTAELGLIGLALYLAVLTGFFYHTVRALPRISKISRSRKLLLIAATGAIAAQCVDAFGNPGWRFGDVSPLFWIMLGLGVAATREHSERRKAPAAESQARVQHPLRYAFARPATLLALVFALAVPAFARRFIPLPVLVYIRDYRPIIVPVPIPLPPPDKCVTNTTELAETIAKSGPALGETIIMSGFSMCGFAKAGWPLVICYELEEQSTAELTITTDGKQSFVIELPSTNGRPAEIIRQLPPQFGKEPQIASFSFQAFKNGPAGERMPAEVFLCGLGLGPHAVGSMVIDRLQFQPPSIRPKLKEKASYSFHSSSDFDTVAAEFRLVTRSPGRGVSSQLAFRETLKEGVARDGSVTKFWDGKNGKGKISQGPHQFYVRAWRGLKSGADWVFAGDNQVVTVVK